MNTIPRLEQRAVQPYAAVRIQAPIPFGKFLQPAWSKVRSWLADQGFSHGPAIIRYLTTDMSAKMDLDVGYVIDKAIPGGDGVLTDVLPAGKYACLMYTGSYRGKGIYKANVVIVEWGKQNNIPWKTENIAGVDWWDSRVEWYFNDPATDPNPQKYRTELTFRAADG